jgi:hypothetical protein
LADCQSSGRQYLPGGNICREIFPEGVTAPIARYCALV